MPSLTPNPQPPTELSTEFPFVSVIVPIYNGEEMLPLLLDSLAQLDYPADRREILLVDNNSRDRTPEILAASPFQRLTELQPGAGAARNCGIQQAQGDFLAFTDADCVVHPHWIKDLLAGFTHPDIGAVAGTIQPHRLDHPIERYEALRLKSPGHREQHFFFPTAVTANVMYRAEVFHRVGLFLPWTNGEETDLNWRMQSQADYRIHFLAEGGLVWHRYRAELAKFCKTQRAKAASLINLHHRWQLRSPTGRKELLRTMIAIAAFLPTIVAQTWQQRDRLRQAPHQVLTDGLWEARLDVLVPWYRYQGIREGWQQVRQTGAHQLDTDHVDIHHTTEGLLHDPNVSSGFSSNS